MNEINDFRIRNFHDNDFSQISVLWEESGVGGAHRGDTLEVIQATLNAGGALLVLEDCINGIIVGTSWLTNDNRRIYLHHFCIRKEYEGKGLGKYLSEKSILFAIEKGLQIKLEVHRDNKRAIELYERTGFSYLGDYLVYIKRKP